MPFLQERVQLRTVCNGCGKPMNTTWADNSLFVFSTCVEQDCKNAGIQLVIEKSSNQVIAMNPVPYSNREGNLYPMLATKEGLQAWPENPNVPHPFTPETSVSESCKICGYLKDYSLHKPKA